MRRRGHLKVIIIKFFCVVAIIKIFTIFFYSFNVELLMLRRKALILGLVGIRNIRRILQDLERDSLRLVVHIHLQGFLQQRSSKQIASKIRSDFNIGGRPRNDRYIHFKEVFSGDVRSIPWSRITTLFR